MELLAHLEVRHDPRLRLHRRRGRCERERREVTAAAPSEPRRAARPVPLRAAGSAHTQRRPPRLGLVVRPGAGPAASARRALQVPPRRAGRAGPGRAAAVSRSAGCPPAPSIPPHCQPIASPLPFPARPGRARHLPPPPCAAPPAP